MPQGADDEYKLLAARSITNLMPLLEATPAQSLYVDSFRRTPLGDAQPADGTTAEMKHWEKSRLGAKQVAIHRGALRFGHSFALTLIVKGSPCTNGLSALLTSALYVNPANDLAPYAAFTIDKMPGRDASGTATKGRGRMWDDTYEYVVVFDGLTAEADVKVSNGTRHGATECPVTRFAAMVDLEGRTVGVIEPLIALQDRINQSVFDLLLAQTYSSTEVRWATGIAPPLKRDDTGEIELDENGNPQPIPMNHNARRFLYADDADAKFGSLPGSPLDGFINSIGMGIQHFSALSQTPPHYLLGQIANLSADALLAAEISLQRKVKEFQQVFGESWERVFRLAAELDGADVEDDFDGEVIWRDVDGKSLAQAADALGKLAAQLMIPVKGLWRRVPDVTEQELREWDTLYDEQDGALAAANALTRATPSTSDSISTAKELSA